MAHFYGSIQGNRGEATRTGSKNSGITAHIRGWNIGVKLVCTYNKETDKDEIYIYETSGSNGYESSKLIKVLKEGE